MVLSYDTIKSTYNYLRCNFFKIKPNVPGYEQCDPLAQAQEHFCAGWGGKFGTMAGKAMLIAEDKNDDIKEVKPTA